MQYPTAQIYRLATTADFPYHACGAQQDNSTVCVSSDPGHLSNPRGVSTEWMYSVGGGESGYVVSHPADPNIFYAGATNALTRYDRGTGIVRDIQPYPRIVMGEPARDIPGTLELDVSDRDIVSRTRCTVRRLATSVEIL
ncbi:MAG: hypothetical protein Ct9H300mP15_13190 [Gemmatimonadota bacterium]|nr:MAG: hypothetical protein Ct9H300mP15_13190 [Gemmatimonadota bacterium]